MKTVIWEKLIFNGAKILDAVTAESFEEKEIPNTLYQGPFGVESLLDPMSISQRHNLIIGHTNFNISKRLGWKIQKSAGVDLLKILSRYSFLFSPGKAFDEADVKFEIEKSLGVFSEREVFDICEYTKDIEGAYCVYVRNGKISCFTEEDENFLDMVSIMREAKNNYGGELYERAAKKG